MKRFYNPGFKASLVTLVILILISSCIKEDLDPGNLDEIRWDPELAIPLANTSFTIGDIVAEAGKPGELLIDPVTGLCSLVYRGQLTSISGAQFEILPDQNFLTEYTITNLDAVAINNLQINDTLTINTSTTLDFETDSPSVYIDELNLSDGDLRLVIQSSVNQDLGITVTLPKAEKNGQVFQQNFTLPAANGGTVNRQVVLDMSGYEINLTQTGNTVNSLTCEFSIQVNKTSAPVASGQAISINAYLEDMRFSLIRGDFGQQSLFKISEKDTIAISIFNNALPDSGGFRINHVIVNMDIENGFGIPMKINDLLIQPFGDGQTFPYPFIPAPTPINIPAPANPGLTASNSLSIGGPNATELNAIINAKPKNLIYAANVQTNPAGAPPPSARNFITDTSTVKIRFETIMPLFGGAWNFTFRDTTPFEPGVDLSDYLEDAELQCITSNGFPFDIEMNIDFTDSLFNILQTLQPDSELEKIIRSAQTDMNGIVTQPTAKTTRFILNRSEVAQLKNVKHIIIRARGNTANYGQTDVKIYDHYRLDFKLGLKGNFDLTVNP